MLKKGKIGTFKIAATYIGTVVGAGFATGQEILQFFIAFGISGLWGIIITTILFVVFGFIIMEMGYSLNAKSYIEIINPSGKSAFGIAMDAIISFFLFGSLTAMMAGTSALLKEQFGLSKLLGSLIMAVLSAVTVLSGKKGVINSISAVVPFLLLSVIGISIFAIIKKPPLPTTLNLQAGNSLINNWILSALLYVSYNTVISIAVLGPLGASAVSKKAILKGCILGGIGLGASSVMIYLAICANMPDIKFLEIPMTYIAGIISKGIQFVYIIILVAEVYTTAVGSLYGFSGRLINLEKTPQKGKIVIIGITISAFCASFLGFSNLIKFLYPLVGYAGILLLVFLIYKKIKFKAVSKTLK